MGLITRLAFGDGKARYEEARGDHHEHLIDIRSGTVVEFRAAELAGLIRAAAAELGYDLLDYRLEVFAERHADMPARARQ